MSNRPPSTPSARLCNVASSFSAPLAPCSSSPPLTSSSPPPCSSSSSSSSFSSSSSSSSTPFSPVVLPLLLLLLLLLTLTLAPRPAHAVRFYMHDHERRCFRFESEYDSLVNAHVSIANGPGLTAELTIEIRDNRRHVVYTTHRNPKSHASFSFRTPKFDPAHVDHDPENEEEEAYDYDPREMEGWFETCLILLLDHSTHDPHAKRAISFWIKQYDAHGEPMHDEMSLHGAKASDSSLQGVTTSLQEIQDDLKHMITDIVILQQRERRLVDHTAATGKRLGYLAVFSLALLVVTGMMQFMHFKTYFKSKKLI